MKKGAVISECGNYRYQLSRIWDDSLPVVMFLMLNPSTADAAEDDPTIRRCINFAKFWGYGGIMVGNLFAWRSKDPTLLIQVYDPIGPTNIDNLEHMAERSRMVICAWGNPLIVKRLLKVFPNYNPLLNITNLHHIDLGQNGTPKHPLYLPGWLSPKKYIGAICVVAGLLITSCASVKPPCASKYHKGQIVSVAGRHMTVHETNCVSRNNTYALRNDCGKIEFFNETEISQ